MKDSSLEGHKRVATPSKSQPSSITRSSSRNNPASALSNVQTFDSSSYDEDYNDWDFGVGNLVIDLDADIDKDPSPKSSPVKPGKMSTVEHQATVDKGLKMKIKRKNVGAKLESAKHEIVKHDPKISGLANSASDNSSSHTLTPADKGKGGAGMDKEKVTKARSMSKKERMKDKGKSQDHSMANGNPFLVPGSSSSSHTNSSSTTVTSGATSSADSAGITTSVNMDWDRIPGSFQMKKENPVHDPYEFNAKVEDRITGFPHVKKIKVEKSEPALGQPSAMSTVTAQQPVLPPAPPAPPVPTTPQMHSVEVETCTVGVATDPDCLGPCEPGTSVTLEGIVWHETENGVLVVNVTWRDKTYVGTLMDATKHNWAPPRLNCDSPASDMEVRSTPKGRGKRGRAAANTPLNDMSNNYGDRKLRKGRRSNSGNITAPPSPAAKEVGPITGIKRKGRPADLDISETSERKKTCISKETAGRETPTLIPCPEPNCNKKYKHINGLRYHQSHAHQSNGRNNNNQSPDAPDDAKSNSSEEPLSPSSSKDEKLPAPVPVKGKGKKGAKSRDTSTNDSQDSAKDDSSNGKKKKENGAETRAQERSNNKNEDNTKGKHESSDKQNVPCSTGGADKAAASSQVYQISGTSIGCLGGVAVLPANQVAGSSAPVAQATAGTTITAVSVSVPTATAVVSSENKLDKDSDGKKKGKVEKSEKNKPKTTISRPIVPAPGTQMTVTHANIMTVSSHAQISPISPTQNLKPIQPKPTIMGEPSSNHPALSSLKEKKVKHKKKKDKDKDQPKVSNKDSPVPKEEVLKAESMSVIKTAPSPAKVSGREGATPKADGGKPTLESLKQLQPPVLTGSRADSPVAKGQMRPNRPPSSLSINSPLQVSTDTREQSDDVQSPAYSDISDVNESAPTLENEAQPKPKEDDKSAHPEGVTGDRQSDHGLSSPYGVYSYYAQPPYLVPAVPQHSPNASQANPRASPGQPNQKLPEKQTNAAPSKPDAIKSEGSDTSSRPIGTEKEPCTKPRNPVEESAKVVSAAQMQEYQLQQQKLMQQQIYPSHGLPAQYQQYMGAYGYPMHLMSSDPHYKQQHEKFLEEQERRKLELDPRKKPGYEKGVVDPDAQNKGIDLTKDSVVNPQSTSKHHGKEEDKCMDSRNSEKGSASDSKPPPLYSDKEKHEMVFRDREREMSLKEKQNENHQILKENIELKTQMEKWAQYEQFDTNRLYEIQREELQRFYLYQQQKMIESNRLPPGDRRKPIPGEHIVKCKPAETITAPPKDSPGKRTPTPKESPRPRSNPNTHKESHSRESSADSRPKETMDTKHKDDKLKLSGPGDKPPTPKTIHKGKPPGPPTPGGGGGPVSYAQYLPHAYLQSPHYAAQVAFDPNHPMYRGMNMNAVIGYGSPAYMHPAQMRYHMSPVEGGKGDPEKPIVVSPGAQNPPPDHSGPKALDLLQQHANHFYSGSGGSSNSNSHKIHELKDAAKSERTSPSKNSEKEGQSPSTHLGLRGSPPPQRHLHTHHHTHVVGGYPIYDPYGALMATQQAATASIPHAYVPKGECGTR